MPAPLLLLIIPPSPAPPPPPPPPPSCPPAATRCSLWSSRRRRLAHAPPSRRTLCATWAPCSSSTPTPRCAAAAPCGAVLRCAVLRCAAAAPAAARPITSPLFPPLSACLPQNARRAQLLAQGKAGREEKVAAARKAKAAGRPAVKKVSKAFYGTMITDSGECVVSLFVDVSIFAPDVLGNQMQGLPWPPRPPTAASDASIESWTSLRAQLQHTPPSPPAPPMSRCSVLPFIAPRRRPPLPPPPLPPPHLPQTMWARTTRCSAAGWARPSKRGSCRRLLGAGRTTCGPAAAPAAGPRRRQRGA